MTSPHRFPTHTSAPPVSIKPLLAAGLLCALAGLTLNLHPNDSHRLKTLLPGPFGPTTPITSRNSCAKVIQSDSTITREQLAQVLTIPERDAKSRVRQIVNEPYCQYSNLQVRSGVDAEREAYPLAFDQDTQLVILYENNEYAGYRFNFD